MVPDEPPRSMLQFRLTGTLRGRAEACARREGLSLTEFAREALRRRCEESERAAGPPQPYGLPGKWVMTWPDEPRGEGVSRDEKPVQDDETEG